MIKKISTRQASISESGRYILNNNAKEFTHYEYFQDAVNAAKNSMKFKLNITALTEFPSHYAFIGDKTILKDIKRTSWFEMFDSSNNICKNNLSLSHGNNEEKSWKIAEKLFIALRKEIHCYVKESCNVGILLSGGMDSRVIASVLKNIQNENSNINVTAFCWGNKNARDFVYSKRIASLYNWDYEHFEISSETLKRNIVTCANEGCPYSPMHIHAMNDVSRRVSELNIECLLGGSYGDSVGRAEYSGVRVDNLSLLTKKFRNWFGLFDSDIYKECRKQTIADIYAYRSLFGQLSGNAYNEIDYQLHYMRNMLGTCMKILNKNTNFYQVFTSNDVVSLMWSFANKCRSNEVYKHLLEVVDSRLLEIPWARTGVRYLDKNNKADNLSPSFHNYSTWVRNDLHTFIHDLIFNGEIEKIGLFNMKQIEFLMIENKKLNINVQRINEILLWLSSLSFFLKNIDWEIDCDYSKPSKYSIIGKFESILYLKRQKVKNLYRYLEI